MPAVAAVAAAGIAGVAGAAVVAGTKGIGIDGIVGGVGVSSVGLVVNVACEVVESGAVAVDAGGGADVVVVIVVVVLALDKLAGRMLMRVKVRGCPMNVPVVVVVAPAALSDAPCEALSAPTPYEDTAKLEATPVIMVSARRSDGRSTATRCSSRERSISLRWFSCRKRAERNCNWRWNAKSVSLAFRIAFPK